MKKFTRDCFITWLIASISFALAAPAFLPMFLTVLMWIVFFGAVVNVFRLSLQ